MGGPFTTLHVSIVGMKIILSSLALLSLSSLANAQGMPVQTSPPESGYKDGFTLELNLGIGSMMSSAANSNSETALAGLSIGLGGFVNRQLAITGRIAGGTYTESDGRITQAFLGPAVQYWATPNFWFGGGIGFGIISIDINGRGSDSNTDLGFDVRAGYTFNPDTKHSFNVSAEFSRSQADGGAISVLGLLAGWQIL